MDYRLEQLRFELQEDPSSRVFFKLGEHLRRVGEVDEAVEVLRSGVESHPHYVSAWVSLGRALHDQGDTEGAWQAFSRALELDPENGVAARCAGEAAIANGQWIEAVKNLKRARGMMPQDETLDERIAFVEERLEELGMLEIRPQVEEGAEEAPAEEFSDVDADADAGNLGDHEGDPVVGPDDVFETGWEEDQEIADPTEARVIDDEDVAVPTEVPAPGEPEEDLVAPEEPEIEFIVDDGTGSVAMADPPSVEIHVADEPSPPPDLMYQPEIPSTPAPEVEDDPEPFFELDADELVDESVELEADDVIDDVVELEAADVVHEVAEIEPEIEPVIEDPVAELPDPTVEAPRWDEPLVEASAAAIADGPLPTMTLARLAVEQGDFELAESTARGVLEREPSSAEARQMLDWLASKNSAAEPSGDGNDGDRRSQALRRWLETVRLAAEKLES
jgi:Flp pilus assembly protein TadD